MTQHDRDTYAIARALNLLPPSPEASAAHEALTRLSDAVHWLESERDKARRLLAGAAERAEEALSEAGLDSAQAEGDLRYYATRPAVRDAIGVLAKHISQDRAQIEQLHSRPCPYVRGEEGETQWCGLAEDVVAKNHFRITDLQDEVKRLRHALAYYADRSQYEYLTWYGVEGQQICNPPVLSDRGAVAQRALGEPE